MTRREQKIALVTNASDYAGPPAVTALVEAGFRVFVHDKTFADASIGARFLETHPHAKIIAANSQDELAAALWQQAGRVDVIVSNDHYPAVHETLEQASPEALRRTLEALVVAPFSLLKASIPRFKAQGGGNVVMITSCRTRLPMIGGAIPDAARDAANALVRSLAIELAPFEIAINAIAPNFLYSEAYYPRAIFRDNPDGRAYIEANVPAQRLGKPEEIGEIITFLAATKAKFLTGAIIDFAGGWPAAATRPK